MLLDLHIYFNKIKCKHKDSNNRCCKFLLKGDCISLRERTANNEIDRWREKWKNNILVVLEKTARRRAHMSKNPNQTEANRSVPTSISHHPSNFIFSLPHPHTHCVSLSTAVFWSEKNIMSLIKIRKQNTNLVI